MCLLPIGSGDQITSGDEADNGDEDRTDDAKEMVKQLNSAGQSRSQEHQRNGPEDPREGGEDNVEESELFIVYWQRTVYLVTQGHVYNGFILLSTLYLPHCALD